MVDCNPETPQNFSKESIAKMECSLTNLVKILKWAFEKVKVIEGEDVVVALGNTGCGKSTMFTSLILGPEALELKKLEETV